MNKEKNRVMSLGALTMFCVLLSFKVGAVVFGVLTIVKTLKYWQDPDRHLRNRIFEDSKRWEVEIPKSYLIRKKLFSIYMRIQKQEKRESLFISSYCLILDEFWQQAAFFEAEQDWISNLSYLERNIPKIKVDKNGLNEALSDLQNLNLQFEKAYVRIER
ncbi:MAG: hypothetical protein CME70_03495 [Halobacteriovorax sp.]|nr:hypothetical protein [Halobacteriovorax sp.]